MAKTFKKDHGLTADQLDDKYNPNGSGEHPGYSRNDWRDEVSDENTISGYWVWVMHKLSEEEC